MIAAGASSLRTRATPSSAIAATAPARPTSRSSGACASLANDVNRAGVEQRDGRRLRAAAEPSLERRRRDLYAGTRPDERDDALGRALDVAVALGVSKNRSEPARLEVEELLLEPERPPVVGEFDQEIPPRLPEGEPAQLLREEPPDPFEVELASGIDVERDPVRKEVGPDRGERGLHRLGGGWVIVSDVWRRDEGARPARHGPARDVTTDVERGGAVVERREDVGVHVDHDAVETIRPSGAGEARCRVSGALGSPAY
jgi:hypothetical protein